MQLQPAEDGAEAALVHGSPAVVLRLYRNRGLPADNPQLPAEAGHLLPGQQLFLHTGGDLQPFHILVDALHRAVLLDEGEGGFFPDARHAGDVVRAIPHQGFSFNKLEGLDAVFFLHRRRVHGEVLGAPRAGGCQDDGGVLVHQLEGIPVPGEKKGISPLLLHSLRQGTQDVVRLVPLALHHRPAQGGDKLLHHRQLLPQLRGHSLALGFVAVVELVAEGGGREVEGENRLLRGQVVHQLQDDVKKAVDGVGVLPVFGGKELDAVKGAV